MPGERVVATVNTHLNESGAGIVVGLSDEGPTTAAPTLTLTEARNWA